MEVSLDYLSYYRYENKRKWFINFYILDQDKYCLYRKVISFTLFGLNLRVEYKKQSEEWSINEKEGEEVGRFLAGRDI